MLSLVVVMFFDGFVTHVWLKNKKIARKWDRFMKVKRADWSEGKPGISAICQELFTPADYNSYGHWKAGLAKLILKKDAVPSPQLPSAPNRELVGLWK